MADLVSAVPPHEPAEDALAFAAKAALDAIPLVGAIAADTLSHALETRQAARQHAFNLQVAHALSGAVERLDEALTVEDVVDSDEFLAALTRAQRVAAETASESKRRRLAAAVANGGSWAPFSASEREQFTRLVDEFDELHVFLLHYFMGPQEWLERRGLYAQHSNILTGGVDTPLATALGAPQPVWDSEVNQALADLERNALADVPYRTTMSKNGIFARRTRPKGEKFLEFINEPASIDAEPPGL